MITIWIAYVWKRSSRVSLPSLFFIPSASREGATPVYTECLSRRASLFATLCKEQNASPYFSTSSALFTKNAGVYLYSRSPFSAFRFLTTLESILTTTTPHKSLRMNTQHPTKDADPERRSGAEGFLPYSGPTLTTVESILTESGHRNSFRMNTYDKTGEGGPPYQRSSQSLLFTPSAFYERPALSCPESSLRGVPCAATHPPLRLPAHRHPDSGLFRD